MNTSASINTNERGYAYILCEADGNPHPIVSLEWKRVDRHWTKLPLVPMIHSVGNSNTTWRFDINITEMGYYRCSAFNGVGEIGRSREILLEIPYYAFSEAPTKEITTEDQQRGTYLLCEIDVISGEEIVILQEMSGDGHWMPIPIKPTMTTTLYGNTSRLFRTENISAGAEKTYRCIVMNVRTAAGEGSEDLDITTCMCRPTSTVCNSNT
ncbi:hypothetical protein HOLleu_06553 [Holothuria leucospilota]|uniref:Ig-like domain-containing protein n=1 Tax=Holothuria leucospilota TaxID=206669 RepID=A0A9Q1CLE8_HOLLE|nr:hypothetical protein HOLleu_06553 [Holothuria leucospilota]